MKIKLFDEFEKLSNQELKEFKYSFIGENKNYLSICKLGEGG